MKAFIQLMRPENNLPELKKFVSVMTPHVPSLREESLRQELQDFQKVVEVSDCGDDQLMVVDGIKKNPSRPAVEAAQGTETFPHRELGL